MVRGALFITAALFAVACEQTPTGVPSPDDATRAAALAPDDATPAAWGNVRIVFGANVQRIRFEARQTTPTITQPFAAEGEAEFDARTADVRGHIRIECLRVLANTATLSGIVTQSSDPTIEGFEAVWQVVDNDGPRRGSAFAHDLSSTLKLHAVGTGSDCAIPEEFDLVPVQGFVEVRPEVDPIP